MNFEVNGIAFSKDELSTIALKDLKVGSISHAHLYYIPASGKNAFGILRAGDYVDQEFIDKYTQKGMTSFYALEVANSDEIGKYRALFANLKNTMNERERQVAAQDIMKQFGTDYWKESKASILSFALTCFDHFYFLPDEVVEKYQNTSLTLYSRSMISASISVMACFVHRVVDLDFIKDLYNTIFVLDYGLLEGNQFSYAIISACEAERNAPGSGIEQLRKLNRPLDEITLFTEHPTQSAKFIEQHKEKFIYPEIIDVIQYHHEKGDGSGFPNGISYSGIGDFETFQMFCDYLVPFKEHIYKRGDGIEIVKNEFKKIKESEEMTTLPINKILSKWEACMEWSIQENNKDAAA